MSAVIWQFLTQVEDCLAEFRGSEGQGACDGQRREHPPSAAQGPLPHTVFPTLPRTRLSTRVAGLWTARSPADPERAGAEQRRARSKQIITRRCAVEKGGDFLLKGRHWVIDAPGCEGGGRPRARGLSPNQRAVKRINRDCGPRVALAWEQEARLLRHRRPPAGRLEAMPLCAARVCGRVLQLHVHQRHVPHARPARARARDARSTCGDLVPPTPVVAMRPAYLCGACSSSDEGGPMNVPDATAATVYPTPGITTRTCRPLVDDLIPPSRPDVSEM
jgi:hypothetical protein